MTRLKNFYIYILTNQNNTVFYIGVTNNLIRRMYEHQNKLVGGFTKKYNLTKLVLYEIADNPTTAIEREKQLKNWHRQWKINLIQSQNHNFADLSNEILDQVEIPK